MQHKPTYRLYHLYALAAVAAMLAACVFSSCESNRTVKNLPLHTVAVLHSWDSIGEEGKYFQDVMAQEFEANGLNVKAHHFYCSMLHRPPKVFAQNDWPAIARKLHEIKPEIILLNDDPIVEAVLSGYLDDSMLVTTPIVFAGVNTLQRDSLKNFPLMTGLEERIDIVKNIEMIGSITNKHVVNIELDYNRADSTLRKQLYNILSDGAKFENNGDFHLDDGGIEWLTKERDNRTVTHFTSAAYPNRNRRDEDSDSVGKLNLQKAYKMAREIPQLQVKYDIFSNSLLDRSHGPQFTCIREQFNSDLRTRFLAGFFVSTRTQIEDQVRFAARIFQGQSNIYLGNHVADFYMDWNAMKAYQPALRYGEYSQTFHIVNAPPFIESPLELSLLIGSILLIGAIIVYCFVHYMNKWRNQGQQELVEQLTYEEKIHKLIFSEANDTTWRIADDVMTVEPHFAEHFGLPTHVFPMEYAQRFVHPDSHAAYDRLRNFRNTRGKKTLRMKLSSDGNDWHWVEMTYTATDETAEKNEIYGLLLNIDKKKEMEERLEQAQILSSEVALKENFLANISHDLKTPLGAITGFSEMLTMPEMEFTDEERAEYCAYIHQNTDMILSMIDDVMHKARTQATDADLEIIQKPVEMGKLINDCYQTNLVIAPSHLEFKLETDVPDCMLNIDIIRTKQVINNFLSNAFKFTSDGRVTLGWHYIDINKDWVEVYVSDTGIGVTEENQRKLFDRYAKVNETDKGTGLGLNISKTIVERQGGSIGVESKIGEGSKFFFRLQKYVKTLLLIFTLAMGAMTTTSCQWTKAPQHQASVLVIHSYDKSYYAYPQFNEELRQALVRNGINPKIRHIYLDLDNPQQSTAANYRKRTTELKKDTFKAEIILAEGDRAASFLLSRPIDSVSAESRNMPIVLGALHHPEWERIRVRPNMVAINDPIDYVTNLNLAVKYGKSNVVTVELDYFNIDSLIRTELRQAISRPPFVDNTDHHMGQLTHSMLTSDRYRDSIVVLTYSVESPERNAFNDTVSTERGYERLRNFFIHSWQYPSLSLKRDIYSCEIVDKTGKPQFTAVKGGFGDTEARYLCGYFSNYTTVAEDLASVGAQLLKGTKPTELTGLTHRKDYYMDYNAMKMLGMKYDDYKNEFNIVNAPIEETSPVLLYTLWALSIIVVTSGFFATVLVTHSWRERSRNDIVKDVKRRATIRHMAINGADSCNIRSEQALLDILDCVHPDYADKLPLMQQSIDIPGPHFYDVYADIDQNGEYHWWQIRFAVMFDKKGKHVDGILYNIDADKQREHEMKLAVELAEEAKQKEDFLTTISHELRTPLNAVVGFSDVLATLPRDQMTDEDLLEYGAIIKANNNMLRGMIEDILMFSRIESHRIKYIKKEFLVKGLIEELAQEWEPLMPEGVKLHVFCLEPEVVMDNDRARVKYILSQMLSNAVKFTKKGLIILGSMYNHNDETVEFVVGDTGCGISRNKQKVMFGLFWKDDEFMPGLGLGLHIAHKLAEGMGLKLKSESTEGYGTKMFVIGDAKLDMELVNRKNASPQLSSDAAVL